MIKLNPKGDPNKVNQIESRELEPRSSSSDALKLASLEDLCNDLINGKKLSVDRKELLLLSELLKKSMDSELDRNVKGLKLLSFSLSNELLANLPSIQSKPNTAGDIKQEIPYSIPTRFIALDVLFKEILDDKLQDYTKYLAQFSESLNLLDKALALHDLDEVYNLSSAMMQAIEPYDFPQRKYIYKAIGDELNLVFQEYRFVSPEDGNLVNPNFHKVLSGGGQRISKGLSYILINKQNDVVLKFGNVKTI